MLEIHNNIRYFIIFYIGTIKDIKTYGQDQITGSTCLTTENGCYIKRDETVGKITDSLEKELKDKKLLNVVFTNIIELTKEDYECYSL